MVLKFSPIVFHWMSKYILGVFVIHGSRFLAYFIAFCKEQYMWASMSLTFCHTGSQIYTALVSCVNLTISEIELIPQSNGKASVLRTEQRGDLNEDWINCKI